MRELAGCGRPGRRGRRPLRRHRRGAARADSGRRHVVRRARPRRRAASGRQHRRRRGGALARGAVIVREGEVVPEADVFVVRDAHRHPWMQTAADVPGRGRRRDRDPGLASVGGARPHRHLRRQPRRPTTRLRSCSRDARGSRLELARAAGGARAPARAADGDRERHRGALRALRRPVRPDRLARQLVERRPLRAVPARTGASHPGRVRDSVALHPLRAAASARRRARGRASRRAGRSPGRQRGDRRGAAPGPADRGDHERESSRRSRRRARRCCRSKPAASAPSRRRRPT